MVDAVHRPRHTGRMWTLKNVSVALLLAALITVILLFAYFATGAPA